MTEYEFLKKYGVRDDVPFSMDEDSSNLYRLHDNEVEYEMHGEWKKKPKAPTNHKFASLLLNREHIKRLWNTKDTNTSQASIDPNANNIPFIEIRVGRYELVPKEKSGKEYDVFEYYPFIEVNKQFVSQEGALDVLEKIADAIEEEVNKEREISN